VAKKIIVIGDIMLDIHHYGVSERTSAEAPISIFDIQNTTYNAGGAANVAMNLKSLEVDAALFGVCGNDASGQKLLEILTDCHISTAGILRSESVPTTTKERFYQDGQQVFRADKESHQPFNSEQQCNAWLQEIEQFVANEQPQCIVLQDYDKGVLNETTITIIISLASKYQVPILVDPKFKNFSKYQGIALLKPNLKELSAAVGSSVSPNINELDKAVSDIMQQQDIRAMMVTLSEKGIYFNDGSKSGILKGAEIAQPDVSGAGDTVIAVCAWLWPERLDLIAVRANQAAAIVCGKSGVQPIILRELF
jgi:rfaE bifunctional protein kinase chain/domain